MTVERLRSYPDFELTHQESNVMTKYKRYHKIATDIASGGDSHGYNDENVNYITLQLVMIDAMMGGLVG